jgi:hypothetical protein
MSADSLVNELTAITGFPSVFLLTSFNLGTFWILAIPFYSFQKYSAQSYKFYF